MTLDAIETIRRYAAQVFRCGADSVHGPHHWRTAEKNGLLIAPEAGQIILLDIIGAHKYIYEHK